MRIKIEDLPKGVDIKEIVIDFDLEIREQPRVETKVVTVDQSQEREPKPVPDEMNLSF